MLKFASFFFAGIVAALICQDYASSAHRQNNYEGFVSSRITSDSQRVGDASLRRMSGDASRFALSNSLQSAVALLLSFDGSPRLRHSRSHRNIVSRSLLENQDGLRQAAVRAGLHQMSATENLDDVGVVLLSAGTGKRMGANIPKQYLQLLGKEIALRSLDVFLELGPKEIVIVCAEEWRNLFEAYLQSRSEVRSEIKFALGGAERQNSVENGVAELSTKYAVIHDSARPLVTPAEVCKVIADARLHDAALLAVPTKATIKQAVSGDENMVDMTPNRDLLWEAHTPQVISTSLLREGFNNVQTNNLAVTDDVSIVELLGKPVKLTRGEYTNIKVTTPEDIGLAETILRERGESR